jgi:hypothetical protein
LPSSHFTDEIFPTHEEYSKLLAGAHRQRVDAIGTPAVIRHLAFWNPWPEALCDIENQQQPNSRSEAVDCCIAAVYQNLIRQASDQPPSRVIENVTTNSEVLTNEISLIVLFARAIDASHGNFVDVPSRIRPDPNRAIKISLLWHNIPTALTFLLRKEFLEVTLVLDASRQRINRNIDGEDIDMDFTFSRFYHALSSLSIIGQVDPHEYKGVHEALYHDIWSQVDRDIMRPLAYPGSGIGKMFVDLRGIVLGTRNGHGDVEFSPPFAKERGSEGTGLEREPGCHLQDFDRLWGFITCALPADTEFSLSRFLAGRAICATALGAQSGAVLESRVRPLSYLLYEDTVNPWQLSRLIYRLHRACTAQIAAIVHFDDLRRAGSILDLVEDRLERAKLEMTQSGRGDNAELQSRQMIKHHYAKVEAELAGIYKLPLDGTLDNRIERSRYYVKQFYETTEALRIDRVSGFQPFHKFVEQRMASIFEYVDGLGRTYWRVRSDRAELLRHLQTQDSLDYEALIAEAQGVADIALSCVLGPYYVGYVVSHGFIGLASERAIWLSAMFFGLIMSALIGVARKYTKILSLDGDPPRGLLDSLATRRVSRFALALLLAIPLATMTDNLLPPAQESGGNHSVRPVHHATSVPPPHGHPLPTPA